MKMHTIKLLLLFTSLMSKEKIRNFKKYIKIENKTNYNFEITDLYNNFII